MRVTAPNNTAAAPQESAWTCTMQLLGPGSQWKTALLSPSQQRKPCQQNSEAVSVKAELLMPLVSTLFVAGKKKLCFDFSINTFDSLKNLI